MAETSPSISEQILPGMVRTLSPIIAAEVTARAADFGLKISEGWANLIGLVGGLAFYAILRWRELNGSKKATRVLGLGMKSAPTFKE